MTSVTKRGGEHRNAVLIEDIRTHARRLKRGCYGYRMRYANPVDTGTCKTYTKKKEEGKPEKHEGRAQERKEAEDYEDSQRTREEQ